MSPEQGVSTDGGLTTIVREKGNVAATELTHTPHSITRQWPL